MSKYHIEESGFERLEEAPNLCGMGDYTSGNSQTATREMFKLSLKHGFKAGVLHVAVDVLSYLERDSKYTQDWGNICQIADIIALLCENIGNFTKLEKVINVLKNKE